MKVFTTLHPFLETSMPVPVAQSGPSDQCHVDVCVEEPHHVSPSEPVELDYS